MSKQFFFLGLTLLLVLLSACQLDAETSRPLVLAQIGSNDSANTPTPEILPGPTTTAAVTATTTTTPTNSPPPSATPTAVPPAGNSVDVPANASPEQAQKLYQSGNFSAARQAFEQLLNDSGASADEQRQALYWRGRAELALGEGAAAATSLQQFLQAYPGDRLARAAQFNLGRALQQTGQPDEAIDAYYGSIVPNDPVNVYIYELIGDLYLSTGAYTQTIAAYQNGIDATNDRSFQVHLREGIAQAQLTYSDTPADAITQYDDILNIARIAAYRAKILRLRGDAYRQLGNEAAAIDSYLEAVNNYPEAYDSYLALVELVDAGVSVDEFRRGLIDYHAEAYQPAVVAFERYLESLDSPEPPAEAVPTQPLTDTMTLTETAVLTGSGSLTETAALTATAAVTATAPISAAAPSRADEALWLMGLSYKALGQYSNAIATFQRLIEGYPDSRHWGEAHLEQGKTMISQDNNAEGKAVLRRFAGQSPQDANAPEALWFAARIDMSDELFEDGYRYMHQLIERYPTSSYVGEALYWAGQSAYQLERYEAAVTDWTRLADGYPFSDLVTFATYWRARALEELAQEAEAEQLLGELADGPLDYYRLRARDRLVGGLPEGAATLHLPTAQQQAAEQAEADAWLADWLALENPAASLSELDPLIRANEMFRRGDTLLALGLRDKALVEFEQVKDNWWDNAPAMYQLAHYFHEQQLGRLSIIAAARVIFLSPAAAPDDAPLHVQRLYYPVFFGDVILQEAEANGVEPAVIAALIRQESLFEPSAESIVGARGLMQVMPATGEYVAQRSSFGPFSTELLWRPHISIKFGAWYISQQLGIFEGNKFAAMAAYNAGPGNVIEWLKISDDLDIFVESIPFWESRTYIRKVYVNLAAYRRLYGSP